MNAQITATTRSTPVGANAVGQSGQHKADNYAALAWLMHSYPDKAIFRRFEELSMLHLLRLQAELQEMEHELQQIREEDLASDDTMRMCYEKDFRAMRDNAELGDSEQLDQLTAIGSKLREYQEALLSMLAVRGAKQPTVSELDSLEAWLERNKGGNGFLAGQEANMYAQTGLSEYLSLSSSNGEDDAFVQLLGGRLLDLYHFVWGSRRKHKFDADDRGTEVRTYSGATIVQVGNITAAILSSVLPTLVILVLYFIKRTIVRIGLIIVFTALFSLALALFTAARKVEIFSATAAFAAVEVVFIGSTNSTG